MGSDVVLALLQQTRPKGPSSLNMRDKLLRALVALMLGALLGLFAKYTDNVPLVGAITTRLGIWILIATLMAAFSRSPEAAAAHALFFFGGMVTAYYAYATVVFGFFPRYYFYVWGAFALLSPLGAWVVWYSRGSGWAAALSASLPISVLLSQGYPVYYTRSVVHSFEFFAAVLLFSVLPRGLESRIRILALSLVLAVLVARLNIVAIIFGGL